jgi:hypothetical protein
MTELELVVDNDAPPEVVDVCDGIDDLNEAIDTLKARRMYAIAYLYETIGKPMFEAGQKTKTIDGIVYHCEPPRDHLVCLCHATYVFFCPNGPDMIGTKWVRMDDKPRFFFKRANPDAPKRMRR